MPVSYVQFTLRAHRGMDLPVHGEGGSVRSYLYVTDVAQAYILVLHKGVIGDTYNIGTQKVLFPPVLRPALHAGRRPACGFRSWYSASAAVQDGTNLS